MSPPENPEIPAAVRAQWDELVETAAQMVAAHDEYEKKRLRCHELVIELLRAGVRRRELEGVPFSPALLSRIRKREGLPMERRRREAS